MSGSQSYKVLSIVNQCTEFPIVTFAKCRHPNCEYRLSLLYKGMHKLLSD